MKESERIVALFALAKVANQHRSLAEHLSVQELGRKRDSESLGKSLQRADVSRQVNQEKMNYTYGL